jgi:hypothetical protein
MTRSQATIDARTVDSGRRLPLMAGRRCLALLSDSTYQFVDHVSPVAVSYI